MKNITIKPVEIQISPSLDKLLTFAQEYKEALMRERIKFKKGDIIINKMWPGVERRIDEVRKTGYSWSYPEWEFEAITPGGAPNHWWSENSNDPFFEIGWEIKE